MEQTKIDEEIEREEILRQALLEEAFDAYCEELEEYNADDCLNDFKNTVEELYDKIDDLSLVVQDIMNECSYEDCHYEIIEDFTTRIEKMTEEIRNDFDNIYDRRGFYDPDDKD